MPCARPGDDAPAAARPPARQKPHGRWPEHLLQDTPGLILIGSLPGALVIMSYAIENGFFPYLVGKVSTLQFVFTSAVVALATTAVVVLTLLAGVGIGGGSTLWFPILLTLFPCRRAKPHPLVLDDLFGRILGRQLRPAPFMPGGSAHLPALLGRD